MGICLAHKLFWEWRCNKSQQACSSYTYASQGLALVKSFISKISSWLASILAIGLATRDYLAIWISTFPFFFVISSHSHNKNILGLKGKMPPKKVSQQVPGKKTVEKKKEKVIEVITVTVVIKKASFYAFYVGVY